MTECPWWARNLLTFGVQGRSPLHLAVRDNAVNIVKLLLDNDADADLQDQQASQAVLSKWWMSFARNFLISDAIGYSNVRLCFLPLPLPLQTQLCHMHPKQAVLYALHCSISTAVHAVSLTCSLVSLAQANTRLYPYTVRGHARLLVGHAPFCCICCRATRLCTMLVRWAIADVPSICYVQEHSPHLLPSKRVSALK